MADAIVTETAVTEVPKSFAEYQPIMLSKENLNRVGTLLFGVDLNKLSGQELATRLREDADIVRAKYSLPDEQMLVQQPDEYYHRLESIAAHFGIQIRQKKDFSRYFKEHLAGAVHFRGLKTIATETLQDTDDKEQVFSKAADLEHELIHGLQNNRYSRMPLVRREYEAYIASANKKFLETKPLTFLEKIALSITREQLDQAWQEYKSSSSAQEKQEKVNDESQPNEDSHE